MVSCGINSCGISFSAWRLILLRDKRLPDMLFPNNFNGFFFFLYPTFIYFSSISKLLSSRFYTASFGEFLLKELISIDFEAIFFGVILLESWCCIFMGKFTFLGLSLNSNSSGPNKIFSYYFFSLRAFTSSECRYKIFVLVLCL